MDKDLRRARAIEKVNRIKKFHNHLKAYLVVNIGLLVLRFNDLAFVVEGVEPTEARKLWEWLDWNFIGIPLLWGVGLLFHAAKTYGWIPFLGDKWEERKIKELMEQDNPDE